MFNGREALKFLLRPLKINKTWKKELLLANCYVGEAFLPPTMRLYSRRQAMLVPRNSWKMSHTNSQYPCELITLLFHPLLLRADVLWNFRLCITYNVWQRFYRDFLPAQGMTYLLSCFTRTLVWLVETLFSSAEPNWGVFFVSGLQDFPLL
jgi:hypothetical protein